MTGGSVARRYARALMAIADRDKSHQLVGRQVGAFARAMKESFELTQTLGNPVFPKDERRRLLQAVLSRLMASKTVQHFFLLLLDRERINIVPDVARALDEMIDAQAGRVNAVITSAKPLTAMQVNQLTRVLENLSGKKVQVEKKEDPNLLGGVVAQVGDIVYDGSLRTQLEKMRESLAV